MMRPLVLYGTGAANEFVVSSLAPFAPVYLVRESPPVLAYGSRILRRREGLAKRVDRLAFAALYGLLLHRRDEAELRQRLGGQPPPRANLHVVDINGAAARLDVRALAPDLVLVLGTSLLDRRWLELGVPIVNVHTGIAPRYRGRFCWLWPILEGNPADVGVTLHRAAARADAGRIVRQRRLTLPDPRVRSFVDLLHPITLLARDLCHELLARGTRDELREGSDPPPPSNRAYFEPGVSDFVRYLLARR
jgi:hypothetical protein